MEAGADPTTVLDDIHTGRLQVASVPTSSEPTTPSCESPIGLDAGLRGWLADKVAGAGADPKSYVKLLLSNAAAGSVIGKGGAAINEVQANTCARMQLSKASEYFPGTTERTLLVTGRLKQVVAALALVFAKLVREGVAPLSPRSKAAVAFPQPAGGEVDVDAVAALTPLHLLVRLLLPVPMCGLVIGKNGTTIRSYAADTNTVIRVTSSDTPQTPSSHRIVTIAGEQEGVLKAIALMVVRQSNDPKFPLFGELPAAAPPPAIGPAGGFGQGGLRAMPNQHASSHFVSGGVPYASTASGAAAATYGMLGGSMPLLGAGSAQPSGEGCPGVSLMLTADQAAALLDQGSQPIVETERMTGSSVRLEMVDGPFGCFGRLLLAGPPNAVVHAQWLLGQRLAVAASYHLAGGLSFGGTTYYDRVQVPYYQHSNGYLAAAAAPPGTALMSALPPMPQHHELS